MVTTLTSENFEKEVFEAGSPVIVDFWAVWCGPCQMMGPVFENLSKEYEGKLKFAKLNVDDYGTYASKFGVMGIPALVIFDGKKEIGRIVGFNPGPALKQKIDMVIA